MERTLRAIRQIKLPSEGYDPSNSRVELMLKTERPEEWEPFRGTELTLVRKKLQLPLGSISTVLCCFNILLFIQIDTFSF